MTPPPGKPLILVAAVARNRVIGRGGTMPWHLPGDLARFRQLTMGHPLLMGRTTFEAIGRPLPGRLTTVLSRQPNYAPAGVAVTGSLPAALRSSARQAEALGAANIMVVGGGALYAATIALARRLLITEVDAEPAGDVLFPPIDPGIWRKTDVRIAPGQPGDSHAYRFVRWDRHAGPLTDLDAPDS